MTFLFLRKFIEYTCDVLFKYMCALLFLHSFFFQKTPGSDPKSSPLLVRQRPGHHGRHQKGPGWKEAAWIQAA